MSPRHLLLGAPALLALLLPVPAMGQAAAPARQPQREVTVEPQPVPEVTPEALSPADVAPLPDAAPATPPAPLTPATQVPADPLLTTPLQPLGAFDATPVAAEPTQVTSDDDGSGADARYEVQVTGLREIGLDGQFRSLSALYKGSGRPASGAQIQARLREDVDLADRLLRSQGYYDGRIEPRTELVGGQPGRVRAILAVTPGERYRFATVTLDRLPPDREAELSAGFALKVGEPIVAAAVEGAEAGLTLRLAEEGYPFAEVGPRDVLLDDGARTGDYRLTVQSGALARYGRIILRGEPPFSERHAGVIARFKPGDRYDGARTEDFRRALVATQLFAGVSVQPVDSGQRNPDGSAVADIVVRGQPAPPRTLGAQAGYSTGEGFRLEGLWRHRNLLPPEGALTVRAVAGTREQRLAAELRKSNFGQRDRSLILLADAANQTLPAFQARTLTLGGRLLRETTPIWQKRWTYSVGVEVLASDERDRGNIGRIDGRRTFFIAALPGQIGYDASNDLLNPTRGFRLLGRVSPETSLQGGVARTYVRSQVDGSYYQSFSDDFVLAGRLRVGAIVGADRDEIAPTRRFYAGGGGSVRGFGFQDLGPRGANGRPLGGKSLAEASVEARYRFGDFGAVAFVDAGQLYDTSYPRFTDLRAGVGVGARYYTSFGPLRIDVARPLARRPGEPQVAVYISIGQAF